MAGAAAQEQGDLGEAEAQFTAALRVARRYGPEDPRLPSSYGYLGYLYHEQKRYSDAETLFEMSLACLEKTVGRDSPVFASSLIPLANAFREQARYAEAESLIAHSMATLEKALGADHPEIARCLEVYASVLRETGRDGEAIMMEERAAAIQRNWAGS